MFWDHRNKCACGWSIGLLVVGALMVGLSVPFFWFIGYELRNGIEEAAVITSADPTVRDIVDIYRRYQRSNAAVVAVQ